MDNKLYALIGISGKKPQKTLGNTYRIENNTSRSIISRFHLSRTFDLVVHIIELLLKRNRDAAHAKAFFSKAFKHNEHPEDDNYR